MNNGGSDTGVITVAITCYNEGHLLLRAISSLDLQTDLDFDTLVICDASEDPETLATCEELKPRPRTRVVFRTSRGGLSAARNTAFELVDPGMVAFLDADDVFPATSVADIRRAWRRRPTSEFVFGDFIMHKVDEGRDVLIKTDKLIGVDGCFNPEPLTHFWCLHGSSPCHTSLWRRIGGYRAEYSFGHQDMDFWMRAFVAGAQGVYANAVIYEWFRSPHGMNCKAPGDRQYRIMEANILFYDRFGNASGARYAILRAYLLRGEYAAARPVSRSLFANRRTPWWARLVQTLPPRLTGIMFQTAHITYMAGKRLFERHSES